MNEKTDEELLEIVEVHTKDYQPEALEEAKSELTARGIEFNEGTKVSEPIYYAEKYYNGNLRFWDYLIDMFAAGILLWIVYILFGLPEEELSQKALSLLVAFIYYLVMEGLLGKTVGKFLLGLKVVDIDGNKPGWGAIAIRTLCRFIPFEAFTFLLSSGWDKNHVLHGNLHDSLSKTYVVKEGKEAGV
jgi:uncharacterized RDD family membrane protein YckC